MVQEGGATLDAAGSRGAQGWRDVAVRPAGSVVADLLDLPENPVPSGAVVTTIAAADGVRLRAARFAPTRGVSTKGTVCLFQGRSEQIEKYFNVVGRLQRRGFTVATFDWRGQGGSARVTADPRKGHISDFRHYERDLDAFRRQVALPDCPPPYFGLAHSMGGLILLAAAPRLTPWLSRLVLSAPFFDFGPTPFGRGTIRTITGAARLMGLGSRFVPGPMRRYAVVRSFENNPLTGDPERFNVMMEIAAARPDLTVGAPTLGWINAATRAMAAIEDERFPPSVRLPLLMVNAGADRVVSTRAVELMARRLRNAAYVLVPGSLHELMMEEEMHAAQFWAAFDAFVPGGGPA